MSDLDNYLQDVVRKREEALSQKITSDADSYITSLAPPTVSEPGNGAVPVEGQAGRFFAQGLTYGFADEIEALAKSLVDNKVDYKTARNEIRAKLNAYKEQNGAEALSAEMAGAVLPSIALIFGGVPGWTAAFSNLMRFGKSVFSAGKSPTSLVQASGRSATGGGIYGYGASEKEDIEGQMTDALTTAGASAVLTPIIAGAGKITANLVIKKSGKDKMDKAVRQELQRMVNKTGLTPDEIVAKVASGELIAENQSLLYYIKAVVKDSGVASKSLKDEMELRPLETRKDLLSTMQQSIERGNVEKNLLKAYKQTDDEFRDAESKAYNAIFKKTNPELDTATTEILMKSIREFQGGGDTINKMYAGAKPFYEIEDGLVKLNRQPTVKDAEIIYRAIRNDKDALFRSGQTDLMQVRKDTMKNLKDALDIFSPDLKVARKTASDLRTARDAYQYGRKIMNRPIEEIEMFIEDMAEVPNAMQSLRDGVLIQLKSKDAPSVARNIANENKNLYQIITRVFPEDKVDDILEKAGIASQAATAQSKLQIGAGSPTAPLLDASQMVGASRLATGGGGERSTGDIFLAVLQPLVRFAQARGIPDKEAMKIVEVVTARDPDLVQKALIDDNAMSKLQMMIDRAITGTTEVVGDAYGRVRGQDVAEAYDPMSGLLEYAKRGVVNYSGFQE